MRVIVNAMTAYNGMGLYQYRKIAVGQNLDMGKTSDITVCNI